MLRSRIIPCLLIHNNGLYKSVNFKNYKYVGDPLNAVKIFNEKRVDELMILDIDAAKLNKEPNYDLIKKIANQSRMPICYGGGIRTADQAQKISKLGVEKISISSAIFNDINLIKEISQQIGKQSVVVVLDIKKNIFGEYEIFINNAQKKINTKIDEIINELEKIGIGELVINSIDRDGTQQGLDNNIIQKYMNLVSCPFTIMGGAKDQDDIIKTVEKNKIIGIGAGSLFVFKGRFKAVLINYIDNTTRENITRIAQE